MAKIIKSFEWARTVGSKKYDWDLCLDGQIRVLDEGDFGDAKLATVSSMARSAAKKRGLCVRISTDAEEGTLTLQSYEPDDGLLKEARIALWEQEAAERREAKEQEEALKDGKGAEEEQEEEEL